MQIILTGTRMETRRWAHRLEKIIGKKINYAGVGNDAGEYTVVINIGTKEDYPRQRIVRKWIGPSEEISE